VARRWTTHDARIGRLRDERRAVGRRDARRSAIRPDCCARRDCPRLRRAFSRGAPTAANANLAQSTPSSVRSFTCSATSSASTAANPEVVEACRIVNHCSTCFIHEPWSAVKCIQNPGARRATLDRYPRGSAVTHDRVLITTSRSWGIAAAARSDRVAWTAPVGICRGCTGDATDPRQHRSTHESSIPRRSAARVHGAEPGVSTRRSRR
jgi:hypothetical protein